jgi:hypothetical protein
MPPSTRTIQKVLRFLQERKRPVSANVIADHFLISVVLARRALHFLYACGQAKYRTSPLPTGGRMSLWTASSYTPRVDEQDEPAQPSQSSRNTVQGSRASYPHIRGYDD